MGDELVKSVSAADPTSGLDLAESCTQPCEGVEEAGPIDGYDSVEEKVRSAKACEAKHGPLQEAKRAELSARVESLSEQVLFDHLLNSADLEKAAKLVEVIGISVDFEIDAKRLAALKLQIAFALGRGLNELDLFKMVHDIALTNGSGEGFHDTLAACLVLICARHYIASLPADTAIRRDALAMIEYMVPALMKGYISVAADGETFVDGETSSVVSIPRMDTPSRALSAIETTVHECYHVYQILEPKHSGYTPVKTEIEACKAGYAVQLQINKEIAKESQEDAKRLVEARIDYEDTMHASRLSKVGCVVGPGMLYDKMSSLNWRLRSGIRARYDSVGMELAGNCDGFADPYIADFVVAAFAMNGFLPVGRGLYQIFGEVPAFSKDTCSQAFEGLEKYVKSASDDLGSDVAAMGGCAGDMECYGEAVNSLVKDFETYSGCIFYTDLDAWNEFSADYVDTIYEGASVLIRKMPIDDKMKGLRDSMGNKAGD